MWNWASIRRWRAGQPALHSGPAAEASLLARVGAGRRAAFDELYRLYHPRLRRFLAHLVAHPADVDPVLDDTMMLVWQRAAEFDGRVKPCVWIFGIAYRKAMLSLRRLDPPGQGDAGAAQAGDIAQAASGPGTQARAEQARERLRRALDGLSLDQRTVVELCFFHDMGYTEIADVVGCPPETVTTRMLHARRRLRTLMDAMEVPRQEARS